MATTYLSQLLSCQFAVCLGPSKFPRITLQFEVLMALGTAKTKDLSHPETQEVVISATQLVEL